MTRTKSPPNVIILHPPSRGARLSFRDVKMVLFFRVVSRVAGRGHEVGGRGESVVTREASGPLAGKRSVDFFSCVPPNPRGVHLSIHPPREFSFASGGIGDKKRHIVLVEWSRPQGCGPSRPESARGEQEPRGREGERALQKTTTTDNSSWHHVTSSVQ